MNIKYSVVIPTYNRSKTLILTLNSVINQTIPPDRYEIIIVDDGSTDDTESNVKCQMSNVKSPEIRYFKIPNRGPAKARNKGIKESKGEIIFFTDDDCVVPNNWMETLLDGFRRYPDMVGVGGWHKPAELMADNYFQKYLDFADYINNPGLGDFEIRTNIFGYSLAGNTANMAYKKSILEEIGGFDENLYFVGAVDWELKKNIQSRGYHLLYLSIMVDHLKNFNFKIFVKKSFNQGRGRYYMTLKYPDLAQNSNYKISLKVLFFVLLSDSEFFLANFLNWFSMYCGQVYSRYFKIFKNIKKYNAKTIYNFEITKKKIGGNGILHTKIKPFVIEKQSDSVESSSFYSIIIPTYNRSKTLALTLDSVIHQTIFPDQYEIIVVDDGSTDDTELNVKCFTRQNFEKKFKRARMSNVKCPEIRYFKIEHGGPAKARNKGIKESKGDIIFFTDDDCVVPPDWMETLLDGYKRYPNVVGVGGWLKIPKKIEEKNIFCKFINYVYFCTNSLSASTLFSCEILSNDPIYSFENFACNTANLSIKKNVLNEMNGFCEHYRWAGSEDSDLAFRILNSNRQLLYLPVFVDHIKTLELIGFLKMSFKRGANFYLFKKFNEKSLKELRLNWLDEPDWSRIIRRLLYWPHKSLTFLNFLVYKAGMAYMKHKIEK